MLLLFAIGGSALAAASAAAGTSASAKAQSQMNVYGDSVINTFTTDLLDLDEIRNGAGNQIVKYVYESGRAVIVDPINPPSNDDIKAAVPTNFAITYSGIALGSDTNKNCVINIKIDDLNFEFTSPTPEGLPDVDDDGNPIPPTPREPSKTKISFKVVAEVELEYLGQRIKKQANYRFASTHIEDHKNHDSDTGNTAYTYGGRKLESYGKVF